MVTVSAPGKVHLMGEHAVVYGKPALLSAVNLRIYVAIKAQGHNQKGKNKRVIDIISEEKVGYPEHAVNYLLDRLNVKKFPPFEVAIKSQIPVGYHLGSSAALAVALSGAFMYFFKKSWNQIQINELAYEIEKKAHINPSGGDNTASTFGGFIWFRKELEFIKCICQIPMKLSPKLNRFFLIETGRPEESTGEMVEYVRLKMKNEKSKIIKQLNINEEQVKRITLALKDGDLKMIINAIKTGEKTLENIGVVSKKAMQIIREVEEAGGAAKILGGGGRRSGVGYLLCYHKDRKKIQRLDGIKGLAIRTITLGEEGVRLEVKKLV